MLQSIHPKHASASSPVRRRRLRAVGAFSILSVTLHVAAGAARAPLDPNDADAPPSTQPTEKERQAAARIFDDREAGVRLRWPKDWSTHNRERVTSEPGDVRGAWTSEDGAMLIVSLERGGETITPRFLLDLAVTTAERQTGGKVLRREVVELRGKRVARLAYTGPGRPAAFSMEPRPVQVDQVIIPVAERTVVVKLTVPQDKAGEHATAFDRVLSSLTVRGTQSRAQRESE